MNVPEWNREKLNSILNALSGGKLDLECRCATGLRAYAIKVGCETFTHKVQHILNTLVRVRNDESVRLDNQGICTIVLSHIGAVGISSPEMYILYCAFPSWKDWSGTFVFPVPDPFTNSNDAYSQAMKNRTMWVGEYGQRRFELLDFLIHWCTQLDAALRDVAESVE